MTTTAPAVPAELPPHHLPLPRALTALAVAAIVTASTVAGAVSPAAAEGENVAPIAVADAYTTPMGTQLAVADPGFFANDVDPDSTLTLLSVNSAGIAGTVFANNGGGFTYNPTPGFTGVTSFQYRAMEVGTNQFSDWATVTITVEAPVDPNAAPVTVADSYTTPYETPLVVTAANDVLLNDSDADGDPIVAVSNWVASVGTLTSHSDQGTFTYTPPANFSGEATFTYFAFDHAAQGNLVTVTITVLPAEDPVPNTPPTVVDDEYTAMPGSTLTVSAASGVLLNDTDLEPLTASVVTAPALGSGFALAGDGSFTWTAPADFCDQITFSYAAHDSEGASATATVTIRALGHKEWEYCPDDEEGEETGDENGSPTIPTLPLPTVPETPSEGPELSDQPATPARDTLASTGTPDHTRGIGWGALLALLLGLGLVAPRARAGRREA